MKNQLFIKNMVCNRCIKVVNDELDQLGHHGFQTEMGIVSFQDNISSDQVDKIRVQLEKNGFELLDDKNARLVENIKKIIISQIYDPQAKGKNLSTILQSDLGVEYSQLSTLFSSTEGITIEKYFIQQKIERAKELLIYGELNNSEIAYKLDYSSLQHFSSQFRKMVGMTPSEFKKIRPWKERKGIG